MKSGWLMCLRAYHTTGLIKGTEYVLQDGTHLMKRFHSSGRVASSRNKLENSSKLSVPFKSSSTSYKFSKQSYCTCNSHTYTHAHAHTYTHTHMHTHTHACAHTHTHARMRTHTHAHTLMVKQTLNFFFNTLLDRPTFSCFISLIISEKSKVPSLFLSAVSNKPLMYL